MTAPALAATSRAVMIAAAAVLFGVGAAAARAPAALAVSPVPAERSLYADAPNGMFLLEREWTSRSDPRNAGLRQGWERPGHTAGFRPTTVPNAFNARDLSRRGFRGGVHWYRLRFAPPALNDVSEWRLRFESVNAHATVWLNGSVLGSHRGAWLPWELAVEPSQLHPHDNEVVIRVDSRGSPTDLSPSTRPRGWWNYGGILREVYLRSVRTFDVRDLYVTANPGEPAEARIRGVIENHSGQPHPATATIHVTGPDGFEVTRNVDVTSTDPRTPVVLDERFAIPRPRLWTPDDPALYEATVTLTGAQEVRAHFGVRSWAVGDDGRILLNGKPITLRGASFHEQTPTRGAALTPADHDEIVRELKALRANFTRAHYPPHPALLEAFDREGIVFWAQIPVWRVREEQFRDSDFGVRALDTFDELVLRDRNHASIVAWSAANETLGGGRAEAAYLRSARDLVRHNDPTRLVAVDKALRPLRDIPASYREVDAIGINEYVGWYGGRTRELPRDLATLRRRFPKQALVVTEFGAEANRHGPARSKGTYSFQRRFLTAHLRIFDRSPHLSGALVWALRDFAVRPGWRGGNPRPRPPILFKGLFTQHNRAKPAFWAVRRQFARALRG